MSRALQIADIVQDAVEAELRKVGRLDDLCAKTIYPGEAVPADYGVESCGGMLYLRLSTAFQSSAFPTADVRPGVCGYALAYPFEVGILRPSPIPYTNIEIELPDDAAHREATEKQFDDMEAMYRGLTTALDDFDDFVIGSYVPIGPMGGVVGGQWDFTVGA